MTSPRGFSEVWKAVLAEFGTIPRRSLVYIGIVTLAGAACDVFFWSHRPTLFVADYALTGLLVIGWVVVSYAVLMSMVEKPASFLGFAKFLGASVVVALPILLAIGALIVGAKLGFGFVALGVLAILGLILILPLLSGWPVLQSLSDRVISPVTALRATHGIRFPLIALSFVVSGFGRAVPAAASAQDLATAVLLASGNAVVGALSGMLGFAVAVVAYRYMRDTLPASII